MTRPESTPGHEQTAADTGRTGTTEQGDRGTRRESRQDEGAWAMSAPQRATSTSGWAAFGGSVLVLLGAFNVISALTSFFRPEYYLLGADELLIFNFTTWGWILGVLGVVQLVAGAAAMSGQTWARAVGVGLAAVCAIGHMAFLATFPILSTLIIAMSILVIYALMVPRRQPAG